MDKYEVRKYVESKGLENILVPICGIIANRLSEGFPVVRVDLYEVDGKIYFGEMTFTPATGLLFHFSEEFLLEQGKYCQI